jgi:autotransporter adhesin
LSTSGLATLNSASVTNNLSVGGNATVNGSLDMTNGQIHNLANGTSTFDAVNLGQLKNLEKDLSGGIASTIAIANIPQVDESKKFALGIGAGSYNSKGAFAIGASFRPAPNAVIKGSVGKASSGDTAFGVGAGMSW